MSEVDDLLVLLRSTSTVPNQCEAIDSLSHALQCAGYALRSGSDDEMIVACAFHDVGVAPSLRERYGSLGHETSAYFFLLERFSFRVAWLAGSHVDALRYLAARVPGYVQRLSPGSSKVLMDSGGPLVAAHLDAFDTHPWRADALALRAWDEAAKDPEAVTPSIAEIGSSVARVLKR
jgi:predicted HD phosphohydrolase